MVARRQPQVAGQRRQLDGGTVHRRLRKERVDDGARVHVQGEAAVPTVEGTRQHPAKVEAENYEVGLSVAVGVDVDVELVDRLVGRLAPRVDQEDQAAIRVG